MTQTYFRVQSGDRDPADLLDPGYQFSHTPTRDPHYTREGVSVMTNMDDLYEYFACPDSAGIQIREGAWVVVELEGDEVEDSSPVDAHFGEVLVRPTRIVSVQPLGDEFLAQVDAAELRIFGPDDPLFDDAMEA